MVDLWLWLANRNETTRQILPGSIAPKKEATNLQKSYQPT